MKKFPIRFEFEFNQPKTTTRSLPLSWRIFWMTFITMFILVTMQYLGIKPPQLLSPKPMKTDAMETVIPKLQEKKNDFSLKRSTPFISKTYAASLYDEANAYITIDYDTGSILTEKDSTRRVSIASLTKIMTAVVALDLADSTELFTVTPTAADEEPTKIVVEPGEKLTLDELLNAVLLTSANDAAEVIKEGVDTKYEDDIFIKAMNEKAEILGLYDTHFENPQGFDGKTHYSSAHDLAILTQYALSNYPLISEIVKKDFEFLPADTNHKEFKLYNWNGLVDVYPNIFGVKIGNTEDAGKTTIVGSEREGKKVLAVLLGTPGIIERDLWASELLDQGFSELANLKPIGITEDELRIKYSTWQ